MTMGFYELRKGWYEAVPPCIYYIRIYKNVIELIREGWNGQVRIGVDGGKKMYK